MSKIINIPKFWDLNSSLTVFWMPMQSVGVTKSCKRAVTIGSRIKERCPSGTTSNCLKCDIPFVTKSPNNVFFEFHFHCRNSESMNVFIFSSIPHSFSVPFRTWFGFFSFVDCFWFRFFFCFVLFVSLTWYHILFFVFIPCCSFFHFDGHYTSTVCCVINSRNHYLSFTNVPFRLPFANPIVIGKELFLICITFHILRIGKN